MRIGPTARGLIALYGTTLLLAFGQGMVIPTIQVLDNEFGISLGAAAQVITAFALGRFAGQPVGGILVDRFGTKLSVVAGPIVILAATLVAMIAPWFLLLLGAMFVIGLGDSVWMLGREIAGVDLVKPEQRGRLMSGFMGMNSTGMALGPALGGLVADLISFRAVFAFYAGFAAVALLMGIFTKVGTTHRRQQPAAAGAKGGIGESWRSLIALFRQISPELRATYFVLVFATFSMMLYRMAFQSMMPVYADSIGFEATQTGLLLSIAALFVFAMILPAGLITDKIGRKWATVPSTALPGIAFLLIPFSEGFMQLAILMAFIGMANGLSLGAVATSTFDVVPAHARGRLQAFRRTIAEIGAVIGPLFGGFLATNVGEGVPFLVYAPVILFAGLLLAFVARETLVKQPRVQAASP